MMIKKAWLVLHCLLALMLSLVLLNRSTIHLDEKVEKVRVYTREVEFDYVNWTIASMLQKNQAAAVSAVRYLTDEQAGEIMARYLAQVDELNQLRTQIDLLYGDPHIERPDQAAAGLLERLQALEQENNRLALLSEAVLQQQIATVIADLDLAPGGQPVPPLMYHVTSLPKALIVSPRDAIRQDANVSLQADLALEQVVDLEQAVEGGLNVSALVVNVGGVGIYPTMVLQTTNLAWMIETVAHEWIHNYLTLRPLGMLYNSSPQLVTMNETTASLAGKEIAREVYARYYPQFLPTEAPPAPSSPGAPPDPPAFDFRAEMYKTRVTAEELMAAGKIKEAEVYMEFRRELFWKNGYLIRRINQAYFAFYGSYADEPGGAAGEDPVGPAVVTLRQQSKSLVEFLRQVAWMTSYEELKARLGG